jgi:hypothetical protein
MCSIRPAVPQADSVLHCDVQVLQFAAQAFVAFVPQVQLLAQSQAEPHWQAAPQGQSCPQAVLQAGMDAVLYDTLQSPLHPALQVALLFGQLHSGALQATVVDRTCGRE